MTIGIYLLKFTGTDKVYVGQSINIEKRFSDHIYCMKNGIHTIKLIDAFNQYGVPKLEVLCECPKESLDKNENEAIEIFNSVINGFNCKDIAGYRPQLRGEACTLCTITNSTAAMVLHALVDSVEMTQQEIAEILDISINIVKDISCGNSHLWLKETYPIKYAKLEKLKYNRSNGELNGSSKYSNNIIESIFLFIVNNPGVPLINVSSIFSIPYETIKSISGGINHSWLKSKYPEEYIKLINLIGSRKHNGKSAKSQGKEYPPIINPDNKIFIVENIRAFAAQHGLNQGHLGAVLRGKEKQHKGWKL